LHHAFRPSGVVQPAIQLGPEQLDRRTGSRERFCSEKVRERQGAEAATAFAQEAAAAKGHFRALKSGPRRRHGLVSGTVTL
jgi:hypothetical protein